MRDNPGKFRVLVVDDEQIILNMSRRMLEQVGMQVDVTMSVADAICRLKDTTYDLVISDVNMPEGDGFSLLKKLKEEGLQVPCILMSGSFDASIKRVADEVGAVEAIEKPFTRDSLLEAVDRVLKP